MQDIESSIEVEDEASLARIQRVGVPPAPTVVLPEIKMEDAMSRKDLADYANKVFNFDSSSLTDVDKFKRRLIRSIARSMFVEKIPEIEMWEKLRKDTDCDCFVLMKRMRALTLKKLKRLLAVEDQWENVTKVARLTMTDWLLFDLVLVHENVDLIGKDCAEEPKILDELFELVHKYKIEANKKLGKDYLIKAWLILTHEYNSRGRQCSPMLLQRRWYQIKQTTRLKFYTFWYSYRGTAGRLQQAWELRPTDLHTKVAKRFPKIIVEPFPEWEEMIANEEAILREDFENLTIAEPVNNKNVADVQIIETPVETIQIDEDSDDEDVETTCQTQEQCATQLKTDATNESNDGEQGLRVVNIKTEPTDNITNDTPLTIEENCIDQENEYVLGTENIDELATISHCSDNISNDNNELLPKITNVTGGVELIESDDEADTMAQHVSFKACSEPKANEIITSNDGGNNEDVSNISLTADSNKITNYADEKQDFEVHLDDLIILDDGIAIEDDGIDDECEDIIQVKTEFEHKENVDMEDDTPKFDFKLLLTPVVYTKKLDDMDVFKFIDFLKVRDVRIIECSYNESKPKDIREKPKFIKDSKYIKEEPVDTQNMIDQLELETSVGMEIELKNNTISDHQKVKYSSWLLQKPKNRNYNPIQLCKNPDFNTRLKRLNAGFLISEKNRLMLKECKRLTIDLHKTFENKLINGTLYLKNSKFTNNSKNTYTQVVSTYPLVEPRTAQTLEHKIVNLLNETPTIYENSRNITNIIPNVYPESFDSNLVNDLKDSNKTKKDLLTVEISPIIMANKKPPVEIVDNETKETKLNQDIHLHPTLLNSYVKESNRTELNQNVQLHQKSLKLDTGTNSTENVENDIIEMQQNTETENSDSGQIKLTKDDDCCINSLIKMNDKINEAEENSKYSESGQIQPNKDACEINSVERVDDDVIETQELIPPNSKKRGKKHFSKTQIQNSLKKLFMKMPLNYRCSTTIPRKQLKWDVCSKSPRTINISNVYGDALLAESTLDKMINILSCQPIDEKRVKKRKSKFAENLEERNIKRKYGYKVKAQNIKEKIPKKTSKTIEDININENFASETNDKDSNTNTITTIENDKTKEKNVVESDYKKSRFCCWALEKLITNKQPESTHSCPQPVCICCCRDKLLERTLQEKVTKKQPSKKRTVPTTTTTKPPLKKHKSTDVKIQNQVSVDVVQIILSDDDEDGAKDNSDNDKGNKDDPNKNENINPLSTSGEFTNTTIQYMPKEMNKEENLPVQEIASTIQTNNSKQTRNSSLSQTCKTRVYAQNSPIFKNTSTHIEIPPLKVNSSSNSEIYKPTRTSYIIQPDNSSEILSNSTNNQFKCNVLSHINDASKPIFLGKNKILLCSTNKSESPIPELSPKEGNSFSEQAQSLLPPGVQIVLLPSGELALSIQPGLNFSTDEIAKLSEILMSVQQQLTPSVGNSFTADTSETGAEIQKEGNNKIYLQNKNILQTKSNDTISAERPVTPNIANDNNQNVGNIASDDYRSYVSNETSIRLADEKVHAIENGQNLQASNDRDSQNNKKSILSDLMEMSGISENDAVSETKTLNTPKKSPVPLETAPTETEIHPNNLSKPFLMSKISLPQDTRKELSIVSSFDDLKKCHQNSCQFYKMDIETGQILPINLKIKKKFIDSDNKYRQGKNTSTGGPSRCFIDLTKDQGDEEEITSEQKTADNGKIKPIKLIRRVPSTGLNLNRTIILEPLKQKSHTSGHPSKLVNILNSKRSLLKKQSKISNNLSESMTVESNENEDTRSATTDAFDSGSDSDDEPLAKKVLRKRDDDATATNLETESPEDAGPLERIDDAIEYYTTEFLEAETFGDNDEDEDCILGV